MAYSVKKDELVKYAPSELKNFHLYSYEWIDNLHFTLPPHLFLANASEYIQVAKELFSKAGWDGDGQVQLIWIPPFMFSDFANNEDAFGILIWHVKQTEDGISWLLSPRELPL